MTIAAFTRTTGYFKYSSQSIRSTKLWLTPRHRDDQRTLCRQGCLATSKSRLTGTAEGVQIAESKWVNGKWESTK